MESIPLALSTPHILVVDDEPDIRELFRQKFRKEIRSGELRFSFAENGQAALELVQSTPDLKIVFTDLNMPEMNGLDLLMHLRAIPGRVLRSVVVSAYGDMTNIRTAMNQGAMDFIVKPIDLSDLELTLQKAIHEVQAMTQAQEAALAVQTLRVEKETAEQARRAQKEFFDNVTHELRTPLTLLLGPLELALDQSQEAPIRQQLLLAHRNGQHLLSLIEELLDAARLGAGAMALHPIPGDLVAFLRMVSGMFEPLARARQITLGTVLPDGLVLSRFDPPKLQKIVANLLSNALKFTQEGGRVTLRMGITGGQAHVQVQDNGPGIATADLERVFDRFYRAHGGMGTGIGLSLARSLAELHGGALTVQSSPGQGATFHLTLPLHPVAESEFMSQPLHADDGEQESAQPLVLLVEDHADMRQHVRNCLADSYRVVEAEHGRRGLELARELVPDLILSDWMMPEMDGLALLTALHADPATSHIPLVMLTAKSAAESRIEGLSQGADAYLSKPFQRDELRLVLRNLLRRREEMRAKMRVEVLTSPTVEAQMSMDEQFLYKVRKVMQKELANERFGVEQLADELGMSRKTLHRKLSALTGQPPNPFIRAFRLEAAMQMLKQKTGPIGEIAYLTGFGSHSYFSKCFQEYYNISPSDV